MRWKWIGGIVAVSIIVFVATVYLILASYDYNRFKPRIARAVKDATGRELTLAGDISIDIGFSPALVVEGVKLANAAWGSKPEMLEADHLQARVHLLPLLHGDIELERIGLADVNVLLETDAAGRGNWEFGAGEAKTRTARPVKHFDVTNAGIRNINFEFRNGGTGEKTKFTLASLDAAKRGASEKLTVDLKGSLNGQAMRFSGEIGPIAHLLAPEPFLLDLSGQVSNAIVKINGGIEDVANLHGIALEVSASGADLAELGLAAGIALPETDAFQAAGHLKGSAEILAAEDVEGNLTRDSLQFAIKGKVEDLLSLSGIDMGIEGSGKDLTEVGPIFDMTLPAAGPFKVKGHLTGSLKGLSLQNAQGSVGLNGLRLTLNGKVEDLLSLRGIDLGFKGSGKELAEIGPLIGRKLPELGSFDVSGKLVGSTKVLSLQDGRGSVSRKNLRLAATGTVKDLLAFSGMDLEFTGSGGDIAEIGPIVETELPQTGPFSVKGRLTGSAEALSLQTVQGSVSRNSLKLVLNGRVSDLLTLRGLDLEFQGSGGELAEVGLLIGKELPELGPFDLSGHLVGSTKVVVLGGLSLIIDRSDFNGSGKVEFRERPKITLALESGLVDFTTILKGLDRDAKEIIEERDRDRPLFSKDPLPFDLLKAVDADIILKAKRIQARKAQFELGHLTLTLKESELSIDTLEAVYKGVKISGNIHLNPISPPEVTTKFLVQNFDLGSFLREILADDKVEAHIDIAADVKGRGDSAHTLVADLDGTIGFVMGQGYLSKYLDLIAVDLARKVIPFWGSHKEQGRVNCAVVQFDIKNGLATSQAFVFDTQLQILTADGDINLDTEKVNFLLTPKPKDPGLLNLATKLRVGGTIQHPKVWPDMASLATKGVKSLGTLALGPLGLLAPFVRLGAHQKHPCEVEKIAHQR